MPEPAGIGEATGGTMELTDARLVAELLELHQQVHRGRPSHRKQISSAKVSMAPCPKVKRCHCGVCPRCREEARWNRIFDERFADPDYYKERPTPFGSSLGWLA